ncbi:proline rich cell wall protein 1 precursor [Iris pallida]|nr:proline rich cell wall protein 1 precursor [Iris pallida]
MVAASLPVVRSSALAPAASVAAAPSVACVSSHATSSPLVRSFLAATVGSVSTTELVLPPRSQSVVEGVPVVEFGADEVALLFAPFRLALIGKFPQARPWFGGFLRLWVFWGMSPLGLLTLSIYSFVQNWRRTSSCYGRASCGISPGPLCAFSDGLLTLIQGWNR